MSPIFSPLMKPNKLPIESISTFEQYGVIIFLIYSLILPSFPEHPWISVRFFIILKSSSKFILQTSNSITLLKLT